jgi:hypothetical protein
MFECIIDRMAENLGIPKKDALRSNLIKKLCLELVRDQTIIINSSNNTIFLKSACNDKIQKLFKD